ncbi:hypothetical protein [Rhodoflexus caldus]|uniref:hypothetical protein n=1 Tax=Rhodoflexus caldus TaxID=2891236 RepID=UPI002029E9D4|nr:hypothetical protein [Rhodoflexus caldus]
MTPYGEEWKKEVSKMSKAQIIELAAKIGTEKNVLEAKVERYEILVELRDRCRNYLMSVQPEDITVEDCLEELGFGRNGLNF